jgi:hypothetical protein
LDPVSEPLQRIAIDVLGPLDPPTDDGNRYVLVIVDYLTKWAEAYAMPDQTTLEIAKHLVDDFICRFGIPTQLHSDQGRQFESAIFQEMCKLLGIRKTRTTPLHPQSDGQTERMNRTLLDVLAKLAREHRTNWDKYLCFAMAAYRSSVHTTTNETPNRLMLGRETMTPASLLAPSPPDAPERTPWVDALHQKFQDTYELVVTTTKAAQRTGKACVDRRQKGYRFNEGDQVWLYNPKPKKGITPKLDAHRWIGPYTVVRCISYCVYCIKRAGERNGHVVNADRLAPYVQRDTRRFVETNERSDSEERDDDTQDERESVACQDECEVRDEDDDGVRDDTQEVAHDAQASYEEEFADSLQPSQATKRAQRQQRRPQRLDDYEV